MVNEGSPAIAMVGMYGGMWREYNPGCFMIAQKTRQELQKRLPEASIDVYSIDNRAEGQDIQTERMHGLEINFFGRDDQIRVLEEVLPRYDAVVMGGDIIWGGDDVVEDNDIFFVNSPRFLQSPGPLVLFNSVHTFYDDDSIVKQREKFATAVERSAYASVRTEAIQRRLGGIGIGGVEFVPDPVLDVDMAGFNKKKSFFPGEPGEREKPILGISLRERLSGDLAAALEHVSLDDFDVVVFPFSRQYDNLGTVRRIREIFGDKFAYLDDYLDPVESYQLVGELDLFLSDTYHGVVASMLHGSSFISLDVEAERTSRKQQLLQTVGVDEKYNIRLAYDDPDNADAITGAVAELAPEPVVYDPAAMDGVRARIQNHYDVMVGHILASSRQASSGG